MRLKDLHEDVESDRQLLKVAKAAWDQLVYDVNSTIKKQGLDKFDYFEKTFDDIMNELSRYTFHVKDDKSNYLPIHFIKSSEKSPAFLLTRTIAGESSRKYDLSMNINYHNMDFELISISDFQRAFRDSFKKKFIHEFVHFIDHHRADDKDKYVHTKRKAKHKGEYINTPQEFNAFYIQLRSELEDLFKTRESKYFIENPTFDNFKSMARSFTMAGQALLMGDLEERYERALMKRLYQLYQDFYEKFVSEKS